MLLCCDMNKTELLLNAQLQAALDRLAKNQSRWPFTEFFTLCYENFISDRIAEILGFGEEILQTLNALAHNGAERIGIEEGFPVPELYVCRDPDGEYYFILPLDDVFNSKPIFSGAQKECFSALRLDGKEGLEDYVDLLTQLSGESDKEDLENEILLPWRLQALSEAPLSIVLCILGPQIEHERENFQHVFARRGIPLKNLCYSNLKMGSLERMGVQLFQTLEFMHENNCQHQDIKQTNIIIYGKNENIQAKFTDWGNAYWQALPAYRQQAIATLDYETPELRVAHAPKFRYSSKYPGIYTVKSCSTLAKHYLENMPPSKKEELDGLHIEYLKPHSANDVYALGTTLFAFKYGITPFTAPREESWAGMMACFREERWTARQALNHWRSELLKTEQDVVAPVLVFSDIRRMLTVETVAMETSEKRKEGISTVKM